MTAREILRSGELPQREMLILLAHHLDVDQATLYRDLDEDVPEPTHRKLLHDVARRKDGWPLQYLTGRAWFWSLPLAVGPGVLVPRPETECLVEAACRLAPVGARLCDVGTGSGAILAALSMERPDLRLSGVEKSLRALHCAERNLGERAELYEGDLCRPLPDRQDVLVANLPYVSAADYATLPADVLREPRAALLGGPDGLDLIRRLVRQAPDHLTEGGWLLLEVGAGQAQTVADLLEQRGFAEIFRDRDLAGIERVVGGRWTCAPNS